MTFGLGVVILIAFGLNDPKPALPALAGALLILGVLQLVTSVFSFRFAIRRSTRKLLLLSLLGNRYDHLSWFLVLC